MSRKLWIVGSFLILMIGCAPKTRPEATMPASAAQEAKIENVGVAIVLGGGGSRGIAHIGAIEVLEENNIPMDLIVGSSAGSAVGALYADSKDARKVKDILYKAKKRELMDFSLLNWTRMLIKPTAPFKGKAYEKFIYNNLNAKNFSELKIPLAVVTVDSKTGEKFEINSGPIAPAVRASSAIPPLIAPVHLYGKNLFDGGIIEPVPINTAKKYDPKLIIAIDICAVPEKTMPKNVIDLIYKAFWISYYQLTMEQSKLADIYIQPDVNGHGIIEDDRKDELYQLGRKAALAALPDIKKKLKKLDLK